MSRKNENLALTMTIIYLALISLSWALYCLIILFIDDNNKGVIIGLLSWSSTIFATIALLYTLNNWKKQKKAEVLTQISYDCSVRLVELQQDFDSLLSSCIDILNNKKTDGLRNYFNIFYRNFQLIYTSLLRRQSGRYSETIEIELLNMFNLVEGNRSLLMMIINKNEQLFLNDKNEQIMVALSQISGEFFSISNKVRMELDCYIYDYDL